MLANCQPAPHLSTWFALKSSVFNLWFSILLESRYLCTKRSCFLFWFFLYSIISQLGFTFIWFCFAWYWAALTLFCLILLCLNFALLRFRFVLIWRCFDLALMFLSYHFNAALISLWRPFDIDLRSLGCRFDVALILPWCRLDVALMSRGRRLFWYRLHVAQMSLWCRSRWCCLHVAPKSLSKLVSKLRRLGNVSHPIYISCPSKAA